MFIIASSGRCGTEAICEGLRQFSDHEVRHEPQPSLLQEGWLKHLGLEYRTAVLNDRMGQFGRLGEAPYGESFRAANLLPEIRAAAPTAKVLVVVRAPAAYVRSAHYKRVFRKGNDWDRFRLMPKGDWSNRSLAARIALHWRAVNEALLSFAAADVHAKVVIHQPWTNLMDRLPALLGVHATDKPALEAYFASRPNATKGDALPDGYDEIEISDIAGETWRRALAMAGT